MIDHDNFSSLIDFEQMFVISKGENVTGKVSIVLCAS